MVMFIGEHAAEVSVRLTIGLSCMPYDGSAMEFAVELGSERDENYKQKKGT